jgi:hypothetical protein
MIPTVLVGVVGIAEFALLTWLATRFAEGLFQRTIDMELRKGPQLWCLAVMLGFIGYILLGVASDASTSVPMSDFYVAGLLAPGLGVVACLGLGVLGYGAVKLLSSLGPMVRGFGDKVRSFAGGLRGWWMGTRERSRRAAANSKTIVANSQDSDVGSAWRKFDVLQGLCQSLRSQLKEGTAYDQVGEISAELEKVRAAIEADSRKQSALPVLVSDYLAPTEQGLRLYELLLKSKVNAAQTAVKEVEEKTLALMHAKIVALHDQIYVSDIAQLSTVASALEVARPVEVKLEAPAELAH